MKHIIKKLLLLFFSIFKVKNIIVLESHADYTDNARAFYEYLIENKYNEKYKIYWFVNNAKDFKDKEISNVRFFSIWKSGTSKTFIQWIKYLWIVKNAKYLMFSNRNLIKLNRKTITVSLNHGAPIKSLKDRQVVPRDIDYRVDNSNFFDDIVRETQHFINTKSLIVGNPRNDILFKDTDVENKLDEFKKFDKIILWLPTFRKSSFSDREDSTFKFPLGLPIIYSIDDLKKVNNYLKKRNMAIIFKPHPAQDLSMFNATTLSNVFIINDKYLIDKKVQLTEVFKIADALITDYSSIYVDYLLTLKPLGFTIDDISEYIKGFSFDNILDYMPGFKMENINDMYKFIDDISKNKDEYLNERKKINNIFNEHQDGNSSKRLAEELKL